MPQALAVIMLRLTLRHGLVEAMMMLRAAAAEAASVTALHHSGDYYRVS